MHKLAAVSQGDLDRAVRAVVRDCLGVKEGEEALVVCNPATQHLGEQFREETARAGADAVLSVISERPSHGAEPPRTVASAMVAADVVMAPTIQSLSHTAARKRASEAGVRCAMRHDQAFQERVARETICSVQSGARNLADRIQPFQTCRTICIRLNSAALIMRCWHDENRLL